MIFLELFFVVTSWAIAPELITAAPTPDAAEITNTHPLGALLYTRYVYLFQAAGIILLIAMIGAIVLTLRTREGVKRQRISEQLARTTEETVEVVDVPRGGGV